MIKFLWWNQRFWLQHTIDWYWCQKICRLFEQDVGYLYHPSSIRWSFWDLGERTSPCAGRPKKGIDERCRSGRRRGKKQLQGCNLNDPASKFCYDPEHFGMHFQLCYLARKHSVQPGAKTEQLPLSRCAAPAWGSIGGRWVWGPIWQIQPESYGWDFIIS